MNRVICPLLFCLSLLSLLVIANSCKPYDTNKTNEQLLQGVWIMKTTNHITNPQETSEQYVDSIAYTFKGDSCFEYMSSLKTHDKYTFSVDDYVLGLYHGDSLISRYNLLQLTSDSLTLGKVGYWWKFSR